MKTHSLRKNGDTVNYDEGSVKNVNEHNLRLKFKLQSNEGKQRSPRRFKGVNRPNHFFSLILTIVETNLSNKIVDKNNVNIRVVMCRAPTLLIKIVNLNDSTGNFYFVRCSPNSFFFNPRNY